MEEVGFNDMPLNHSLGEAETADPAAHWLASLTKSVRDPGLKSKVISDEENIMCRPPDSTYVHDLHIPIQTCISTTYNTLLELLVIVKHHFVLFFFFIILQQNLNIFLWLLTMTIFSSFCY